jgi:hypothetical protein
MQARNSLTTDAFSSERPASTAGPDRVDCVEELMNAHILEKALGVSAALALLIPVVVSPAVAQTWYGGQQVHGYGPDIGYPPAQGYAVPPAYGSPQDYQSQSYGPQIYPPPPQYGQAQPNEAPGYEVPGAAAPYWYRSPQGYNPNEGYGPIESYSPDQAYGPSEGYGPIESYGPDQAYGPSERYGANPAYGFNQGYGPNGAYYGANEAYGPNAAYGSNSRSVYRPPEVPPVDQGYAGSSAGPDRYGPAYPETGWSYPGANWGYPRTGWAYPQARAGRYAPYRTERLVSAIDLNLRAGPSNMAPVRMVLPAGTPVHIAGPAVGGWWQVETPFGPGWVYSRYIARA